MRALELARDCAALGARVRTIHHLTGLRPRELLHLLFTDSEPPPRGRAPDTREWYHNANLLYQTEASVVIANFRRLRCMGFAATEALISAYRYYQSVYRPPYRTSFDRAFDLAAHTEGRWIAKSPSFHVLMCPRCGSEYLDAVGAEVSSDCHCPFCRLVDRHERDPRLTASFPGAPPASSEAVLAWIRLVEMKHGSSVESPATWFDF
ncbi:FlhC family transcriptional regulator [Burkholderia vietnamiensis]|uniref:FlhC family transcriptional regulator n=1 Tax=Burkholderia vietnamiensis TaxID=60552 RepID=UPI0022404F59|nr:FlhC family transcriptional regulator [Burkholderia vietnamiensis]